MDRWSRRGCRRLHHGPLLSSSERSELLKKTLSHCFSGTRSQNSARVARRAQNMTMTAGITLSRAMGSIGPCEDLHTYEKGDVFFVLPLSLLNM